MPPSRQRKILIAVLSACFLVLLLALMSLNGFNLKAMDPSGSSWVLLFTALSILGFLLCVVVGVLLLRNVLKLFAEQRSRVLGSRLRTRMLVWAAMISVLPVFFMFLFSYLLMNRSIDRWFSQPVTTLREDSSNLAAELAQYTTDNARSEADALALTFNDPHYHFPQRSSSDLEKTMMGREVTLQGGFAAVYRDGRQVAAFHLPVSNGHPVEVNTWLTGKSSDEEDPDAGAPLDTASADAAVDPSQDTPDAAILHAAQRNDDRIFALGPAEYALATAWVRQGGVVVVGLPMPPGMSATVARLHNGADSYWTVFRARRQIRTTYMFLLLMITGLTFFASTWLALQFSTQITRPVEALADAMDAIADGKYERRVETKATGEMEDLVRSFNHMAADLEASRQLAESSSAQLTAANQAIETRRRELETIVETIPSGVVTLDGVGTVLQVNHAFALLMGLREADNFAGQHIDALLPAELAAELAGLIRRSHRMGAASTEVEFHVHGKNQHLAITSARLELGRGQAGSVLVVEDTSEVLRAQRQLAWKEVAQRVAHEIKNPLTPIALSAERIRRHLDRPQGESPNIIRKCSEVILGCVGTLRTLVDQFSALAQFPAPQPRACDMNQVADEALALFAGRLESITVQRSLEPGLPLVLADPDAIRRALANLIDNAAEAMQGSLLRVLSVSSTLSEDGGAVEVEVSDTGHGLTDDIRERLFLPFYSTKHRGTGLGLSIAAKIAQEHGGSIRAEANAPKGARFLLRLPLMEANPAEPASNEGEPAKGVSA